MNDLIPDNSISPEIIEDRPAKYKFLGVQGPGMDNLHGIDEGLERILKTKNVYCQYSGWNFCGYVWWKRSTKEFACVILVYHAPQETIYAKSLKGIMDQACNKYGPE